MLLFRIVLALSCLLATSFVGSSARADEPVREWTFLIFLNGNNNLDDYGARDINEMEVVGSTDKVNVVVQWASLENGNTKRLLVKKDSDKNRVSSPIVEDIGRPDMGDWRQLVEFVRWGAQKYPAKRYFVNVWNHGSGWHLKSLDATIGPKDISFDDRTGNYIKTEQLGQAMAEISKIIGHKVDIYGSDACLMGMAEVADEMAESVETFVGAEEVEPLDGWPYDSFLRRWNDLANMSGGNVAKVLVEEFMRSYSGGSQGTEDVTLSAFDLSKLGALNVAMSNFGRAISQLDRAGKQKITASAEGSQKFAYSDYTDLLDFVSQVEKANIVGVGRDDLAALKAAASELVIANGARGNVEKAQGVAIWFPNSSYSFEAYSARYKGLKFHAHTGWGNALSSLFD